MPAFTHECLWKSISRHLRHLRLTLETTKFAIDRTKKLLPPAKPPVPRVVQVQVADDYERKLRIAAQLVERMSAAGYRCELGHGVMLH
jgi:hypothetical protein